MNSYQKEMYAYIENIMKKEADKERAKEERDNKPSFNSYLKKQGLINSDNENDDADISGSFKEYLDRKKNKNE